MTKSKKVRREETEEEAQNINVHFADQVLLATGNDKKEYLVFVLEGKAVGVEALLVYDLLNSQKARFLKRKKEKNGYVA